MKLLLILMMWAVVGCGSRESDPKNKSYVGDPANENAEPKGTLISSLDGTWSTGCYTNEGCADCGSSVKTFDYSDNAYREITEVYFDKECQNHTVTYEFRGIFDVGSVIAGNIFEYNATATTYLMAYNNADSIPPVNQQNYCGFSDWAVNQLKDLTNTVCDSAGDRQRTGITKYSSVEIADDELKMGGTHHWYRGFSEDDRIREVDGPNFSKK